jgi:hypothetical protein
MWLFWLQDILNTVSPLPGYPVLYSLRQYYNLSADKEIDQIIRLELFFSFFFPYP